MRRQLFAVAALAFLTGACDGGTSTTGVNTSVVGTRTAATEITTTTVDATTTTAEVTTTQPEVSAVPGDISTVAGGIPHGAIEPTTHGDEGDGGAATTAYMSFPWAVAVDGAGNLFIADTFNSRIRRVDALTGIITTYAGNGDYGSSGDGGAATSATLSYPYGVVVDGSGNVFIADTDNHRIRRVDALSGIISTVVGTGEVGSAGDGGVATDAHIDTPHGLALDGEGNLFIADYDDHRVRRVDAFSGIITTVAGTGVLDFSADGVVATSAALYSPWAVAVDSAGNLFIADSTANRIMRVDAVTTIISTYAGTGAHGYAGDGAAADRAELDTPNGIAVDGEGNLFIAEYDGHRVRRVDATSGLISTYAGTGAVWEGFSDEGGDGGIATDARLGSPTAVAFDRDGNLFIADAGNNRIRRVASA